MPSKREILARLATQLGVTRVLESLPGRPSLLILTYHRVGDGRSTPYDSGTFSCTVAELDWQIGWLKERYPILTLGEAVDVVHGRTVVGRTTVLITFDDGYLDNYAEAFPVLRRHGVSATFYLPTAFVGTGLLPWWDEIAFMVKNAKVAMLKLRYPRDVSFDLTGPDRGESVAAVLRVFKLAPTIDTERFLGELEAASGCQRPGAQDERCFLNWDEAREMQAAGMCFGSHTHTHELLSRLPFARQLQEMEDSKAILESELGNAVETLAYPAGKQNSFSDDTAVACVQAGYRTAFSFYSGINVPGQIDPLDVRRIGADGESRAMFRLRAAMYATAGRSLV